MFVTSLVLSFVTSLLLTSALSSGETGAQPLGPSSGAALHEQSADNRFEKLAATLESARSEAHVPGMSIAVIKDDEVVWLRGFGFADVAAQKPADENTLYAVGSTTKAFTALLAEILAGDGKVSLNDPVTKYLPYFDWQARHPEPSSGQPPEVTLRDLLSHRHGFARMPTLYLNDQVSREDVLRTAAGAEPLGDFRTAFHYSNVGYLAAGEALAVAAGSTWDDLMVRRIFKPLEMSATTVSVPRARKDVRLAVGYKWDQHREEAIPRRLLDLGVIGPAGGVHSNVRDMAQWLRLQLGRGEVDGERLIDSDRFLETWAPQVEISAGVSYGLGWVLQEHGGRKVVVHDGFMDGYSAIVAMMPEENLGYVLLMNLHMAPLQGPSIALVFDALLDQGSNEEPVRIASAEKTSTRETVERISVEKATMGIGLDLSEFAGTYIANFAVFEDEGFEILVREGQLALDIPSQRIFDLKAPDQAGRWQFAHTDQIAVSFQRDDQEAVVGLTVHQGGFSFQVPRQGVMVWPEVPIETLQRFVGTYLEVNSRRALVISIERARLFLAKGNDRMSLSTPDKEGFASMRPRSEWGVLFEADEEGNIGSLVLKASNRERTYIRAVGVSEAKLPTVAELLALHRSSAFLPEGVAPRAPSSGKGTKATGKIWVAQAGQSGTFTTYTEGLERYASHLDFGKFGRLSRVTRDGEAWSSSGIWGFNVLGGDELEQALLEHPQTVEGDWTAFFDDIKVLGRETVNDRSVYVLRLEKGDLPHRSYMVDVETGDVLRVHQVAIDGVVRIPTTTTYFDYRSVNGARRAMRVELENPMSGRMVLTFEKIESGLELGDEIFSLQNPETNLERPR